MTLTDRVDTITLAVQDKLELNMSALPGNVQDVWLGDQDRLPRTPCLTVEPGNKVREYNGAPRRFSVSQDTYVVCYVECVQSAKDNVELLMQVSEGVEEVLHSDAQLDGLVVSSFVVQTEMGFADRGGTKLRAARLTFRTTSQVMLPYG
jgi:hypothetical protein